MTASELHGHKVGETSISVLGSIKAALNAAGIDHWGVRLRGEPLGETATREVRTFCRVLIVIDHVNRNDLGGLVQSQSALSP